MIGALIGGLFVGIGIGIAAVLIYDNINTKLLIKRAEKLNKKEVNENGKKNRAGIIGERTREQGNESDGSTEPERDKSGRREQTIEDTTSKNATTRDDKTSIERPERMEIPTFSSILRD